MPQAPGEMPPFENENGPKLPKFIADKPDPESFDSFRIRHDISKASKAEAAKITESVKINPPERPEDAIIPRPYKVGNVNLDDFPANTDFKSTNAGRPLTAAEMAHIEADPRYKNMTDREKMEKIRLYIRNKDGSDQLPN